MRTYRLLIIMLTALMAASCSTHRSQDMVYFQGIDEIQEIPIENKRVALEPGDELLITVTSSNPDATADYNLQYISPVRRSDKMRQAQSEQQTYTVNTQGYIDFPVLGQIYVQGMTTEQVKELLTQRISADVQDPIVTVNLLYYTINITGEVHRPGRLYISQHRYTLFDALAAAGDLTQYGRRDNILLVREEDGKLKHVRINLNKPDVLNSPYFYMKQNDFIYVEPNEIRKDNAEYNQFNSYKLSVVSVIVGASASIISLIIALMR